MDLCNRNSGQQYSLKWTNHTNNILHMFEDQLMNETLVDVILSCEGQFIKAHRMILSACSPYFKEVFQLYNTPSPLIILHGTKFNELKQIIEFMYHGEVRVFEADLDSFLSIAENLQVKGLCNVRGKPGSETLLPMPEEPAEENPQPASKKRKLSTSESDISIGSSTNLTEGKPLINEHGTLLSFYCETNTTDDVQNETEPVETPEKDSSKTAKPNPPTAKRKDSLLKPKQNAQETRTKPANTTSVARPPNAFMIFASEWRKKLADDHPEESNKEISVRLGSLWKSLPPIKKDFYYSEAKKKDEEHRLKYPKEVRVRKESRKGAKGLDTVRVINFVMPDDGIRSGIRMNKGENCLSSNDSSSTIDSSTNSISLD